jgi:hypothetical protein
MSSLVRHRVAIRNADETILAEAVGLLIAQPCGFVVRSAESVKDYYGHDIAVPRGAVAFPLKVEGNEFGLKVYIRDGQIEIAADFHGAKVNTQQFQQALLKAYQTICAQMKARRMGFRTQISVNGGAYKVVAVRG